MPKIWKDAVKEIKKTPEARSGKINPYAVATASLQKSGALKPGTREATKKGRARGAMTKKEREETR